jgi:DNA mismatch repair protein MutL
LALELARDRILESMACHSAVRFHQPLSEGEMLALLADLDRYSHSTNCPHGRPLYIRFSDGDLARLFKRH